MQQLDEQHPVGVACNRLPEGEQEANKIFPLTLAQPSEPI